MIFVKQRTECILMIITKRKDRERSLVVGLASLLVVKDELQKIYETQQKVFLETGRIKEKVDTNQYVLYDVMLDAYKAFQASK